MSRWADLLSPPVSRIEGQMHRSPGVRCQFTLARLLACRPVRPLAGAQAPVARLKSACASATVASLASALLLTE